MLDIYVFFKVSLHLISLQSISDVLLPFWIVSSFAALFCIELYKCQFNFKVLLHLHFFVIISG